MTISSSTSKAGPYDGNDVATSFAFAFKVFTTADIDVIHTDADGVETTLTLTTDYTVTLNGDQNSNPGGTVTYPVSGTPLATGEKLTINRDVAYIQGVSISQGGSWNPTVIENALDRAVMLIQQLREQLLRAVLLAVSDDSGADLTLPTPTANYLLGWNSTGTALENKAAVDLSNTIVSAFIESLLDDSTASDALTTLGVSTFIKTLLDDADAAAARATIGALQNVLTTRGDLVLAVVGGVADRLALGAAGYVLRSDGTDAAWEVPYFGATAHRTSNLSHSSSGSYQDVTFTTESFDSGAIFTATSALFAAPPWAQKAEFFASVTFDIDATGYRSLIITDSTGTALVPSLGATKTPLAGNQTIISLPSGLVPVVGGTSYKVRAFQNSGGALNIIGAYMSVKFYP